MHAYAPSSLPVLAGTVATACTALAVGYFLQAGPPGTLSPRGLCWRRTLAWSWTLGLVTAGHLLLAGEGAGFRMLWFLVLLCYGMRAVVGVESRAAGQPALTPWRWLAFGAIWFGMQPKDFLVRRRRQDGKLRLACQGLAFVATGAGAWLLARHLHAGGVGAFWCGMLVVAAFSLTLHFGVIPILAAGFRTLGFPVGPQFHAPWRSQNLHEFWARRWNVAFSVMTTLAIYRPLARRLTRGPLLMLGFLASALCHEVACSLPVQAGYGLPTLYFLLHGLAVLCEHGLQQRGHRIHAAIGRIWVYLWVLLPVPLLFHMPFLRGVVLPLL